MIRGFTRLQAHVRRRAAKKELKALKVQQRDIHHVKTQARGLANKIIELQQKLDERVSAGGGGGVSLCINSYDVIIRHFHLPW